MNLKLTTIKYIAAAFLLLYFTFVGYNIGKDLSARQQGIEITDI